MSLPFLLEIGCEEIPDWMIEPALRGLLEMFQTFLDQNGLGGRVAAVDATPRRLMLRAEEIVETQAGGEEAVSGPPKSAGAGAAAGFAKKMGVSPGQLESRETAKGEYYVYSKRVAGRPASDLLAEALPGMILRIPFPKTMYWTGKGGPRFIRPIRWIVALLGSEAVPFELAGVRSGAVSSGHRRLGAASVPVTVAGYENELAANGVIVSAEERRRRIEEEIAGLLPRGVRLRPDAELLETLVYVTEMPAPVLGDFDSSYLRLPAEVLVTVMRHHQKYFSLETADGALAPHFIAVMNTRSDPDGLVRRGHERVLRARFNDACFFFDGDQKTKLADRVASLADITFQAKLGSYLDKTNRVVALVEELGGNEHARRAAMLAKCDLTTGMVKEFTELQGVVGGLYARQQGEPEAVWRAVYEHYKPLAMEDSIPATEEGRVVALADKLDTLRECFRAGLIPSGSKDPFALRRAAQGAIKILVEGGIRIPLRVEGELREFFADRVRYYFKEVRGFRYDEVNAVLAAGWENLPGVEERLIALRDVRPSENFEPLAAAFKRIRNILKQAGDARDGAVDERLLEPGPEARLNAEFERVRAAAAAAPGDYAAGLAAAASLRPAVDAFFDHVLVNAADPRVRANRLTLLRNLLAEFSTIADFSEIVTEKT